MQVARCALPGITLIYTQQRHAEHEESIVYIQTSIKRHSENDAMSAEELIVGPGKGFKLIIR